MTYNRSPRALTFIRLSRPACVCERTVSLPSVRGQTPRHTPSACGHLRPGHLSAGGVGSCRPTRSVMARHCRPTVTTRVCLQPLRPQLHRVQIARDSS